MVCRRILIGLLGGDYLEYRRLNNLADIKAKYEEHLRKRDVRETLPPRLTLALPLLQAAADESNAELQDVWARLLAAAMDPGRSAQVRIQFIEAVKQMEPLDALMLQELSQNITHHPNSRDFCAKKFGVSSDQIEVSIGNLIRLGCVMSAGVTAPANAGLVAFGRALISALND